MNYVLHFQSKNRSHQIALSDLKSYFQGKDNYTVNDYQAVYSNEDTGVYFTFVYGGTKEAAGDDRNSILPVYFNVSYAKPHIFVLEAEPELTEFIQHFDLLVSDLLMKGSGYSEFNELDFYKGWTSGNQANYRSLLQQNPNQNFPNLPFSMIEKCWRWNYHVKNLQSELGQQMFVPRILLINNNNVISTAVVWTDAMPIALPKVDQFILYRRELAPGRLRKHQDIALIKLNEVEPLLGDYPLTDEHFMYYTMIYTEPPRNIKQFFQSQKSTGKDDIQFIAYDEIHDKEMIESLTEPTLTTPGK